MHAVENLATIPPHTLEFYRSIMNTLNRAGMRYLVGGAYALHHYTGVQRHTKDFDIFILRQDYEAISSVLAEAGYKTELTYPHWLAKAHHNGDFIDLVFSSGNAIAEVDEKWFEHADTAHIFDIPTRVCPAEEIFWSKAFIMERERFDGADIAHLILVRGGQFDWQRLMQRFDPHWRLLLSHLVLFGFIYPAHRDVIPNGVMEELLARLKQDLQTATPLENVCAGTLLSREQYLNDIGSWGYNDLRLWLDKAPDRLPKGEYGVDKWINDPQTVARVKELYTANDDIRAMIENDRRGFLEAMGEIKQKMILGPDKNVYVEPIIWTVEYVQREKYQYPQTTSN